METKHDSTYNNLIQKILDHGVKSDDRTGVGTIRLFGDMTRYDLSEGRIPLLTTKKVFTQSIIKELLWFISGSTDEKKLSQQGCFIWKKNSDDFHKKQLVRGVINHKDGDLGPVYGFSWRHFGANYSNCGTPYKGVDQLQYVIDEIKTNPESRRIMLNAWDPRYHIDYKDKLVDAALPPCHVLYQFSANPETKELSCLLYQRSCDMVLGVPFNIVSASILTHMIAQLTGYKAKELIHSMGDLHIYSDHIEKIKEQIKLKPKECDPKIKINEKPTIDDFVLEDFEILDYVSHPKIDYIMSV